MKRRKAVEHLFGTKELKTSADDCQSGEFVGEPSDDVGAPVDEILLAKTIRKQAIAKARRVKKVYERKRDNIMAAAALAENQVAQSEHDAYEIHAENTEPAIRTSDRVYKYTKLNEVTLKDRRLNIWAVVYDIQEFPSVGEDARLFKKFHRWINVFDETCGPSKHVLLTIIGRHEQQVIYNLDDGVKIHRGVILRLHRVQAESHNGFLTLTCDADLKGSWMMFPWKSNTVKPMHYDKRTFNWGAGDESRLWEIRKYVNTLSQSLTLEGMLEVPRSLAKGDS
jgi:hypothetical protein